LTEAGLVSPSQTCVINVSLVDWCAHN